MTEDPRPAEDSDGVDWNAVPYQGPPRYAPPMDPPVASGQAPYPPPHHGQPPYGQPPYGQPPYGQPPYGQPPYGPPPYGPPPYGPPSYGSPSYPPPEQWPAPYAGQPYAGQQPPGRPVDPRPVPVVVGTALGFAAGALLLMCTLFLAAFAALLTVVRRPDGMAGTGVVVLQLVLAALLVTGAALALAGRWQWLVLADGALVVLSLWWLVGSGSGQLLDTAPTVALPLVFTLLAGASGVLVALPASRAWAQRRTGAAPRPPAAPGP
ncbi:hypothetical protein [uncultured Modestobacter sp.]|uniref:hypothetical protein n=1 Tax=uncultured Modestobacter sp. TaxID=380048 RepID=UPI0026317FF5|nr:hypothetical protein [uncultured Modestobacter sp.]